MIVGSQYHCYEQNDEHIISWPFKEDSSKFFVLKDSWNKCIIKQQYRVATCQGKVRENKIFSRSGNFEKSVREF